MGLFSLHETCAICGEDTGLNKFPLKGKKYICFKCLRSAGLNGSSTTSNKSVDDIKLLISNENIKREFEINNQNALQIFKSTKEIGSYLKIDEQAEKWLIPDGFWGNIKRAVVHSYDEILGYELLEDGGSVAKGGLGRAVAGGLILGPAGAVIGGITGKKKSKGTCSSLEIKITLNNMETPTEYIELISSETSRSSFIYKSAFKSAQEILSILQVICESNNCNASEQQTQPSSSADEIMKFKNLLDQGIITKEEFELKKKQLLGI